MLGSESTVNNRSESRPARDVAIGASWAFIEHRPMSAVTIPQEYVQARVIEARDILWDRNASPSLKKLAARVVGRWSLA